MKKVLKKQIATISVLAVVLFSGGFLTVNAATDGKIVEDIKTTIYNMLKDNEDIRVDDSDSIKIQDVKTDENGNVESVTYTFSNAEK